MLVKSTPGVHFINILRAAFLLSDSKRAKRQSSFQSFFALLGSVCAKAVV